ncbi:MAG: hypothetical protein HYZ26_00595 [Chloroflexi bacterium]|nr:hypothetical protein [Chloroflexota bacterium]
MSQPILLVALKCPQCGTPVPAQLDEVAWACATCKTGLLLDEEKGLVRHPIHFQEGLPEHLPGRPFWVAQGKVTLDRQSRNLFDKDSESARFWGERRPFFVPAWACDVDELVDAAIALLQTPPTLKDGPPAPFQPVVMPPGDMLPVADYIVVGVEALRKDQLKKLDFTLDLGEPELWILP